MSQESLSALLDGECSPAELDALLAEFEASSETRGQWNRYCAVREALTGTRYEQIDETFCAGVMAAITALPAQAQEPAQPSKVVAFPRRRRGERRWAQPMVGLAAAASIAGAVVIGGNALVSQSLEAPSGKAGGALASAEAGLTAVAANEPQETRWGQLDADAARQLGDYMMEHSNYRAEQSLGGSLSYARMALRNADYRPAAEPR